MARAAGRVRTVSVRVTARISDFEKKMRQVERTTKKIANEMTELGKVMTTMFTVPFTIASASIAKLTNDTMAFADKIDKMSVRTGISTQRLQELEYITGQVGVEFKAIEKSVGYLTRRMNSAIAGTGEYADIFRKLNVELEKDGAFRNIGDIYQDTIISIANMTDETQQAMLTFKLFGTQARELLPLMKEGGAGIEELASNFRELGLGLGDESLQDFVRLADVLDNLQKQTRAIGMAIASAFAPAIEFVAGVVSRHILPTFQKLSGMLKNVHAGFIVIVGVAGAVVAATGPLLITVGLLIKTLTIVGFKFVATGAKIGVAVAAVAGAVVALGLFIRHMYRTNEDFKRVVDEMLAQVYALINTIREVFGPIFQRIMNLLIRIARSGLNNVLVVVVGAVKVLTSVFSAFSNLLRGDWGAMWQDLIDITTEFRRTSLILLGRVADGILSIFEKLAELLIDNIFVAIGNGLVGMVNTSIGWANRVLSHLPGQLSIPTITIDFDTFKPSTIMANMRKVVQDMLKNITPAGMEVGDLSSLFDFDFALDSIDELLLSLDELEKVGSDAYDNLNNSVKSFMDTIMSKKDEYMNFAGIFQRANMDMIISADRWINRLKGQARALEMYQTSIATLRGFADDGLISQSLFESLKAQGVSAAAQLRQIAGMDPSRLAEASAIFGQKEALAGQLGVSDVMASRQKDAQMNQIVMQVTGNNIMSEDDEIINVIAQKIINQLKQAGALAY